MRSSDAIGSPECVRGIGHSGCNCHQCLVQSGRGRDLAALFVPVPIRITRVVARVAPRPAVGVAAVAPASAVPSVAEHSAHR